MILGIDKSFFCVIILYIEGEDISLFIIMMFSDFYHESHSMTLFMFSMFSCFDNIERLSFNLVVSACV